MFIWAYLTNNVYKFSLYTQYVKSINVIKVWHYTRAIDRTTHSAPHCIAWEHTEDGLETDTVYAEDMGSDLLLIVTKMIYFCKQFERFKHIVRKQAFNLWCCTAMHWCFDCITSQLPAKSKRNIWKQDNIDLKNECLNSRQISKVTIIYKSSTARSTLICLLPSIEPSSQPVDYFIKEIYIDITNIWQFDWHFLHFWRLETCSWVSFIEVYT